MAASIFRTRVPYFILFVMSFLMPGHVAAGDATLDECLLKRMIQAADETTVGEIRADCLDPAAKTKGDSHARKGDGDASQQKASAIDRRLAGEMTSEDNPFTLLPHRLNYLLPVAFNDSPNPDPYEIDDEQIDNTEVKFQISLKFKLFDDLFQDNGDLYVAYTNLSFWQAYNDDNSSPFRETNHEPEVWLSFKTDWDYKGFENKMVRLGAVHQSNGRGGELSRSWNRIYLDFIFERDDFYFSFKPWYRIPEDEKAFPGDPDGDDNADIEKYLGYGEFRTVYKWNQFDFSIMLRNNLRFSGNKGAIEAGWTFPLHKKLRGYVQYFNGYGESLIDYDDSTNRLGAGVVLSDWL